MDSNHRLSSASAELVDASNSIGFKVLLELANEQTNRNPFISPLSVTFALCMLYNGAASVTRQVLGDFLTLRDLTVEEINSACLTLRSLMVNNQGESSIRLANALWAHESLQLVEEFVRTVKQYYAADVRTLNFTDPAVLEVINGWAREQTGGKIYPLLTSDDISAATECVLCSAAYFRGTWAQPFPRDATRDRPFHLLGGHTRDVPMMERVGQYQFYRSSQLQVIGLPYDDGRSMYLFLPSETSKTFPQMNCQVLEESLTRVEETQLTLVLPRFSLTYESDMRTTLTEMGLGNIFQSGKADFSAMGAGDRSVQKFKHKTMVEVNEKGTEAAAVSAVVMNRSLPKTVAVLVNRPFLWIIRDNLSQAIIFAGFVFDPKVGE